MKCPTCNAHLKKRHVPGWIALAWWCRRCQLIFQEKKGLLMPRGVYRPERNTQDGKVASEKTS